MSQDRTFVPEMSNSAEMNDFLYSRDTIGSASIGNQGNGTVVPGMARNVRGMESPLLETDNTPSSIQMSKSVAAGMPVVGFLYSISNQGVPEYWPLLLGYNRIGRNEDNEVVLREQTVSGVHASIMIQKKRNGEIVSVIRLEQGRTGVLVNDEEVDLRYGSECKNGDVIQIGSSYILAVVLINAEAMGLKVADHFIPTAKAEEKPIINDEFPKQPIRHTRPRPDLIDQGTMSMDGISTMDAPGETHFM